MEDGLDRFAKFHHYHQDDNEKVREYYCGFLILRQFHECETCGAYALLRRNHSCCGSKFLPEKVERYSPDGVEKFAKSFDIPFDITDEKNVFSNMYLKVLSNVRGAHDLTTLTVDQIAAHKAAALDDAAIYHSNPSESLSDIAQEEDEVNPETPFASLKVSQLLSGISKQQLRCTMKSALPR